MNMPLTRTGNKNIEDFNRVINWEANGLTAYDILGLEPMCIETETDVHNAFKRVALDFHHDKYPDHLLNGFAQIAFQEILEARQYLLLNLNKDLANLKNNRFYKKYGVSSAYEPPHVSEEERWKEKTRARIHGDELVYIGLLQKVVSLEKIPRDIAEALTNLLESNDTFGSKTVTLDNEQYDLIGLFLQKNVSDTLLSRLYHNARIREDYFVQNENHKDHFIIALENRRLDFFRMFINGTTMENFYGMERIQASALDDHLWRFAKNKNEDLKELIKVMGYRPKDNTDMTQALIPDLNGLAVDFESAHIWMKGAGCAQYINYQKLFNVAINTFNFSAVHLLYQEGWVRPNPKTSLEFPNLLSFLQQPNSHNMIGTLEKYGFIPIDIASLTPEELKYFTFDYIIERYPLRASIWQNREFVNRFILIDSNAHSLEQLLCSDPIHYFNPTKKPYSENNLHILISSIKHQKIRRMKGIMMFDGEEEQIINVHLFRICSEIAQNPDPIQCGNKYAELIDGLIELILENILSNAAKYNEILNTPLNLPLYVPNVVSMTSFTPLQLLVVLQHTQALTRIIGKKDVRLNAIVHYTPLTAPASEPTEKSTNLVQFAEAIGYRGFERLFAAPQLKQSVKSTMWKPAPDEKSESVNVSKIYYSSCSLM